MKIPIRLAVFAAVLVMWAPIHLGSGMALVGESTVLAVLGVMFGITLLGGAFLVWRRIAAVCFLLPIASLAVGTASASCVAFMLRDAGSTGAAMYVVSVASLGPIAVAFVSLALFKSRVSRNYFGTCR